VADGEALCQLAGFVSAAPWFGGEDPQPPDPSWFEPCGPCVAFGGARLSPRQERIGCVLPSHPGASGWCEGGGGDGAEDRRAGVAFAEIWGVVRASGDGSVRSEVPRSDGAGVVAEGAGVGFGAGADGDGVGSGAPVVAVR